MNTQSRDEFRLICFTADQIPLVWPTYRPLIQKALDRGSVYDSHDIFNGLISKKMQLWAWGAEACLVTSIQESEGVKFCLLVTLAGKGMKTWFKYLYMVEEWAEGEGATEMRVYGRPGWIKQTGYGVDYCRLSKKLGD